MIAAETVVVGAGPAGIGVALALAAAGREALVLDRATFPRDKPCGDFIGPGAVAALARLGLLAALGPAVARPVAGMRLTAARAPALQVVGRYDPARPGLAAVRRDLDAALLAAARARGARVLEGTRVVDLLRDRWGGVRGVRAQGPDGGPLDVLARVVVGADGRHSVVARRLGLARPVAAGAGRFAVRAFWADPRAVPPETPALGEMHLGEGRTYCGLSALPDGRASVCLVADRAALPRRPDLAAWYDARIAALPSVAARLAGGRRVSDVDCLGPLAVGAAGATADGALLVGDAAGFFDPLTGEGMLAALRGAELAAATIAEALDRDDVRAAALAPYPRARRRELASRLAIDRLVQRLVPRPGIAAWLAHRMAAAPAIADALVRVTGGDLPPRALLAPGVVAGLLGAPWAGAPDRLPA